MSQEKVDRYKKEKANRQQIMKREKRVKFIEFFAFFAILAALLVWFSIAVYQNTKANAEANAENTVTTLDLTDYYNYISDLSAEE